MRGREVAHGGGEGRQGEMGARPERWACGGEKAEGWTPAGGGHKALVRRAG